MTLHEARVSQLLPTIKCNTCGDPVEFRKLSEHVCGEVPDMPALPTQYKSQSQKNVDRLFKDESILNLEDNRSSIATSEASSLDQEDSLNDILPTRTRKKQPTREPPTADYASRFAKETENTDTDNQTANFLERYDQLIGNKSSSTGSLSKSPPSYASEPIDTRSRKPKDLVINTNRDSSEEMYQHRKKTSGSRSSSEDTRSPPSSKEGGKTYRTPRSERSSASSSSTTTRPIDVPAGGRTSGGRSRPDERTPQSPASTRRQNSGDPLSPSALRPPMDAFFDMRTASPRLEKANDDDWSNPRPAPKPTGQPFRGSPMSPSVLSEFNNLNLESTRPAPRPPNSSGRRTPGGSHRSGDGQSISRSRTPQYSDNPGSSSVRGRSPAPPSSSRHVRRASGSSSSGASSSSLSRSRDAPPMPRGRTSDEQVRSNQLGVSADPHTDEPLSPASRPGSHRHCTTCRNKIGGAGAIHLNETSYHRTCFRCAECRTQLDVTDEYKEIKGRVLCGSCIPAGTVAATTTSPPSSSTSRGPPICAGCNGTITGKSIKALGSFWHDVHLQCAHCRQPLTRGHVEHRGRAYCPEDFTHLFLPKCKGCTKPVEREALVALDGKWHARCFNCQVCHKPFPNKSFYVFQKQPFCKYHYHMLNNSLCKRCESPIEGPCAQVLEGRFHPQCFSCETCEVALTDVYYNFQGRFFCEHDVTVIQRRMNMKADRRKTMIKNI